METFGHFVGGEWRSEGPPVAVRSPFDGAQVGEVRSAPPEVLDAAVEAAVRAQPALAALPRERRAGLLERIAEGISGRRDELAGIIRAEMGKPIAYARVE